jgi:hypothetical protein
MIARFYDKHLGQFFLMLGLLTLAKLSHRHHNEIHAYIKQAIAMFY